MDKLLETILNTTAPSGYEANLQKEIRDYTKSFSNTKTDSFHNLYSIINEDKDFRVLMTAHADEIGLVITNINSNGTCSVRRVGGVKLSLYVGVRVNVLHNGSLVKGIMGIKNGVFESKVTEDSLFLDLGVDTKEEAMKLVSIGDELTLDTNTVLLNDNRLISRALDDKIGCYIITKALEELSKRKINNQVCACNTVCEETGLRGAYGASVNFKPNIAIAVDVTYTSDVTGNPADTGNVKLGGGAAICHSSIIHKKLNSLLTKVAVENKIDVQYEVMIRSTGTDADKIHFTNDGVPVCLVSIPLRYMHSGVEMCDLRDVNNCIKLLVEFISAINKDINLEDLEYNIK